REALALLEQALPIAEKANHRMLGPILTTLADLHCSQGKLEQGAAFAARAVTVTAEHTDIAPWYADQAVLVQSYCQALAGGKPGDGLDRRLATLKKKWGQDSPFTQRAAMQLATIEKGRAGRSDARRAEAR